VTAISARSLVDAIHFLPIYPSGISFQALVAALPHRCSDMSWSDHIQSVLGYTRLAYFGLSIDLAVNSGAGIRLRAAVEQLSRKPPFGPFQCYCWSMENRLSRYDAHAE
jgi:hypothetical protein